MGEGKPAAIFLRGEYKLIYYPCGRMQTLRVHLESVDKDFKGCWRLSRKGLRVKTAGLDDHISSCQGCRVYSCLAEDQVCS